MQVDAPSTVARVSVKPVLWPRSPAVYLGGAMAGTHTEVPASALTLRWALAVFALAVVARLAYLAAVYDGAASLQAPDSQFYLDLGRTFARWIESAGREGSWMGQPDRFPLYPAYLALVSLAAGSDDPLWPVLGQVAIDAVTCVLIARLAARLDPHLAAAAGLFAALNPNQIVHSGLVLTDVLFLPFVVLFLDAGVRWLRGPSLRSAAWLGVAGGLALLTRAVIWPFLAVTPVVLLVLAGLSGRLAPLGLRRFCGHVLAFAAIACLALSPVMIRNVTHYGTPAITTQNGVQLLYWVAPLVREAHDGTPYRASTERLRERFEAQGGATLANPFDAQRLMIEIALAELRALGPAAIARAWAYGAAINLGAPAAILSPPIAGLPRTGFYATPGSGMPEKIANFLLAGESRLYAWVLLGALLLEAALRMVQAFGLFALARRRALWPALVWLVCWSGFILAINGPVASAKYRLPFEPVLAVLAAAALMGAAAMWRRQRR